ncbi:hypothetical protein A3D05_00540 [Candidatus Gottesmanbacteria bacterium RIFCSPHIGHO2_02_FULL_40_24]|uniref:Dephospho-CoA kinase n=1 Tax=Candidatus Gottesmanbacteria bacterium RIFCSPHIGHO2_01_FULL_40_15 TaxID=1798376 RepID=A0A1F5Z6V3_9BACT|nr:MAG: hypothetical protein A2777_01450 [Candidatus Gottesmanbacteria bacterium RIFCSPHIGHO2_01_FULL_40_15]OGG18232.1 MAG: hypothetical protein A3D05_00540 [Candidatus Gottesmanbacteria bacterium RIFCSPHIGHO2_02_FULL_40_24]OGG23516.1 MAG: hypothetical protein A3E42_00620 [Candidatus Gottesmanbacteria bacterium RIFCSPHIGHO2_12_FULL_40_13]
MSKTVVILTGLPGTGKTIAGNFFVNKNIPVIRMGDITGSYLKKQKLQSTEENEYKIRRKLRGIYGLDVYARKNIRQIFSILKKNNLAVVEGMRSPEEYKYFKRYLSSIKIIFLESRKQIRIKRLIKRISRNLSEKDIKKRDDYEINDLKINSLKKTADFIIRNNDSKDKFFRQLHHIINSVNNNDGD